MSASSVITKPAAKATGCQSRMPADAPRSANMPANAERAAWDAAVQAYEVLKREHDAEAERSASEFSAYLTKFYSDELLRPSLHYPLHVRWHSAREVENDPTISAQDRDRLKPLVEAARAFGDADPARDDVDDGDARYERVCEAEAALLALPAPDLEAAIYKGLLLARESDDDKQGLDNPGRAAFLLNHYYVERQAASLLLDLMRLAHPDHPALQGADFDPDQWIKDLEDLGGMVSCTSYGLLITDPEGAPEGAQAAKRIPSAEPWKIYAVYLAAAARKRQGGDPIFDSDGRCGAQDQRYLQRAYQQLTSGVRVYLNLQKAVKVYVEPFETGAELRVQSARYRQRNPVPRHPPLPHLQVSEGGQQ